MIYDILANVGKLGVSKPNRFVLELFLNPIIEQRITEATHLGILKRMMFMCETSSLPGRTLTSVEYAAYGQPRRYPYQHLYDTINVTFRCSSSMTERRFFDAWQDTVIDPVTYDVNFMNEYTSDIVLYQLDNDDRVVYSLKLHDCYPVTVNALDLDHSANDEYHKLDVEFSYDKWVPQSIVDQDRFRAEARESNESWFDRVIERANIGDKLPNIIRRTF